MKRVLLPAAIILIAAVSRLLPHPANFTPVAAIALTGAVYLDRRWSLAIPLVAMLLSDAILGFHNLMFFVYIGFIIQGILGWWVRGKKSVTRMAGATVAGSILFFIVTNFGVWFLGDGSFYAKSLEGLTTCYVAAIPFLRNSLAGDIVFVALIGGVFEVARVTFPSLMPLPENAHP